MEHSIGLDTDEIFLERFVLRDILGLSDYIEVTTKRVVVAMDSTEESFSLQSIRSVTTTFQRSWPRIAVGMMLVLLGLFGIWRAPIAWLFMLLGVCMGCFGWTGKTRLSIVHSAGQKVVSLLGQSRKLRECEIFVYGLLRRPPARLLFFQNRRKISNSSLAGLQVPEPSSRRKQRLD